MPDTDIDPPIMPTGSGVADLEIARELDALTANEDGPDDLVPTNDLPANGQTESEAHPS